MSKVKFNYILGREKKLFFLHSGSHVLKVEFNFALLWVVYAVVVLKVKQALFFEPTRTDTEDLHIFFGVFFSD